MAVIEKLLEMTIKLLVFVLKQLVYTLATNFNEKLNQYLAIRLGFYLLLNGWL